jgi:hypothetical protein
VNTKITGLIREGCAFVRTEMGIQLIRGGPWFEWDTTKIIASDPIGAVILHQKALPEGLDPSRPETLVNPGLIQAACRLLDVDHAWLYRFWMGYDRQYQILFTDEEKKTSTKDDVSEFGINLGRELFR